MRRPLSHVLALCLGLSSGLGLDGPASAQAEAPAQASSSAGQEEIAQPETERLEQTADEAAPPTPPPPKEGAFDDPFFSEDGGFSGTGFDDVDWGELENWAAETEGAAAGEEAGEPPAANAAEGEEKGTQFPSLELKRTGDDGKERRIRVVRRGEGDETGIFAFCQPPEGFPADAPTLAVFSESGPNGVEITISDNVIQVPLAVVTQRSSEGGGSGDGQIEAGGGSARYLQDVPQGATERLDLCAVAVERREASGSVQVTQGATQLSGQSLKYDETDGIAFIAGPVQFKRSGDNAISGTSESIEVNVDNESTVLVGAVELRSEGGRVSRAARVEYNDAENLARLLGTPEQPATSTRSGETLQALEILYDLERDEAVAWASEGVRIKGTFEDTGR